MMRTATSALILMAMAIWSAPLGAQQGDAGQQAFREHCGGCHLEDGWASRVLARRVPAGEAALEKRTTLPAAYVEMVVRRGIGSMPQLRRAELDDATLKSIAAYLERKK